MTPAEKRKIRSWKGGHLPLFVVELHQGAAVGTNEKGETLYEVDIERRFIKDVDAIPFGEGFALLKPSKWDYVDPSVVLEFDVRDGRPQCVSITPAPGGPELTSTLLRKLNLDSQVREFARESTLRLEVHDGKVIGVGLFSPREGEHWRRVEDVEKELGSAVRRRGRPPLSDADLERVAEVYREAKVAGRPVASAVAAEFHLSDDAAKKRIRKARERGFLQAREEKK